jgi:hypothetical protein
MDNAIVPDFDILVHHGKITNGYISPETRSWGNMGELANHCLISRKLQSPSSRPERFC